MSSKQSERDAALLIRDGAWTHEVSNDEVSARRRGTEFSVERMADMPRGRCTPIGAELEQARREPSP